MSFYPITVNTPAIEEAHIFAEDDAAIYQAIFGEDCVFDIGSCLKATVLSNNKVRIGDGVLAMGGHIGRNKYGDYEDLTILNGTSGQKRNDLIVARFATTGSGGIDTFTLAVKQGTPGTTAEDPAITLGSLYEGASLREFPLYRVKLEGLSITAVEQLFKVRKTTQQLEEEVAELNRNTLPDISTSNGLTYEKYKNGRMRIYGKVTTSGQTGLAIVGLEIPFKDINYTIQATPEYYSSSYTVFEVSAQKSTISSFNIYTRASNSSLLGGVGVYVALEGWWK